jgi:hypothetical protein
MSKVEVFDLQCVYKIVANNYAFDWHFANGYLDVVDTRHTNINTPSQNAFVIIIIKCLSLLVYLAS